MNRQAILAIAGTAVRRLFRDRANIFFVFVFPMLLVVLIGTQFGGDRGLRLAVTVLDRGPEAEQVLQSLGDIDAELVRLDDRQAVLDAVAREEVDGGDDTESWVDTRDLVGGGEDGEELTCPECYRELY